MLKTQSQRTILAYAFIVTLSLASIAGAQTPAAQSSKEAGPDYRIQLDTVSQGWEGRMCWAQARAGAIPRGPGKPPIVVVTASPLLVTGSDVYFDITEFRTDDLGKTWSSPKKQSATLGRRVVGEFEGKPMTSVPGDFWPAYHAQSGKLLGLGVTFTYVDDKGPIRNRHAETCYTTYDPDARTWSEPKLLDFADEELKYDARAACVQRYDLPDGDILLPIYFKPEKEKYHAVKVLRCGFDGKDLTVNAQGNTLRMDSARGLAEPSITFFRGKYYLTIRHDLAGYVATSDDGLQFGPPKLWTWTDGTALGTYNTQAHWVRHTDGLFLVYTRRGANNDHVFRHRAPLFIAQVDTDMLAVRRETERVLIPEHGARYGNFGVCEVNEHETWVVETEWMQRPPEEPVIPVKNRWGADARIYAARIIWNKPNQP